MRRRIIVELLTNYAPTDGDEICMRSRMLEFVLNNAHCFDRSCEPGHITGSAWVVNPARSHVLLTHHRKLKRWFQPGGHSDGDHDTRLIAIMKQRYLKMLHWTMTNQKKTVGASVIAFCLTVATAPRWLPE